MKKLIKLARSIIIACDVSTIEDLSQLVKETARVKGIGGYKVGAILVIKYGLAAVVSAVKKQIKQIDLPIELPVIYDHQKAGTDIPDLGSAFVKAVISSGADALILFPFGGMATEKAWINACQDNEFPVLVGGCMTQPEFLEKEGGFIANTGPSLIYKQAAKLGVRDFVMPGNRPELIRLYRRLIRTSTGCDDFALYTPGFISQNGHIAKAEKQAGQNWHAIIGRAIYEAKDRKAAAEKFAAQIIGS
ncbi:orotidine 5'-phosphate decarboxylase [Patescibacteria group bacterium]|nr:orotidine 5'-phosphate decarboxylase [Patescibacteria group bacterium]MBU4022932.1 orotidine 5'-phosphate decarboxylase [Patescibacteria group bacterium]